MTNKFNTFRAFLLSFFLFLVFFIKSVPVFAQHADPASLSSDTTSIEVEEETQPGMEVHGVKKEKFNAGKLISEHIGDSHDWHIMGEGESLG